MLSFIGLDPRTAELRYTFGSPYLYDGLDLVPVFLGVFALAQIIELAVSGRRTISGKTRTEELAGSVREGILSVFRHFGLFLRSSLIGAIVGVIPGIGAAVASFLAYDHAARTAGHDRDRFGRGDVRGVLAPEAANDAKDGGSLVPTLAFGIPGSATTAVLLAMLTVHGLVPGRAMLTDHLPLVFALIWSLFLSNWLTSIVGLAAVNPLVRLTTIPIHLLAPPVLILVGFGAYVYRSRIEDVAVVVVFGLAGYWMIRYGWPRIPLVIGLVFGPLFESNLHLTLRLQQLGRIDFWSRPVAMILLALTVISLGVYFLQGRGSAVKPRKSPPSATVGGLTFTLAILLWAGILFYLTLGLGRTARLVPQTIALPLLLLLLVQATLELRRATANGS
jgi:putative tricarboxylic transport membrane protein